MSQCICEFPDGCGGTGVLQCEGCGGDLCVCACCDGAGESECYGCEDCESGDSLSDDEYCEDQW